MTFENLPIRQKLMAIVLGTSGVVLLIVCSTFLGYEFVTFRQSSVQQLSTLGEIIATNSTAALAFSNRDDATEVLAAPLVLGTLAAPPATLESAELRLVMLPPGAVVITGVICSALSSSTIWCPSIVRASCSPAGKWRRRIVSSTLSGLH